MKKFPLLFLCILFLGRCADGNVDRKENFTTQPPSNVQQPKIELSELDTNFCWSIHAKAKAAKSRDHFRENISFTEILKIASEAKNTSNRDRIAKREHSSGFDFINLVGVDAVGDGAFEISYDLAGDPLVIEGPEKPGAKKRFRLDLFPTGSSGFVGHIDLLCGSPKQIQDCNHHCGFFYFEKGCRYNIYFGLRPICQQYSYNPHNIGSIIICDENLKPFIVSYCDFGKISSQVNLQYDENCKLLPSPFIDFEEEHETPLVNLDEAKLTTNSILSFALGNLKSNGKILKPENLNGLLWQDCSPIFWGNSGHRNRQIVADPCR
jgi:hypothetical protein